MTEKYKKYVELALRINDIKLQREPLNLIIATIELVQAKGGKVNLKDTIKIAEEAKPTAQATNDYLDA